MLFYGGTFLHYKKFVNKFLWLCALVHNIFMSCAHAHMIGEHKKACTFILFKKLTWSFFSFLAKITSLASFRT